MRPWQKPVYQVQRQQFLHELLPNLGLISQLRLLDCDCLSGRYLLVGCVTYFGGDHSDVSVYRYGTYNEIVSYVTRYWPEGGERVFARYGAVDTVEIWRVVDSVTDQTWYSCDVCGYGSNDINDFIWERDCYGEPVFLCNDCWFNDAHMFDYSSEIDPSTRYVPFHWDVACSLSNFIVDGCDVSDSFTHSAGDTDARS